MRVSLPKFLLVSCLSGLCALFGCSRSGKELREWRPEDHQPPPSVVPEGQGVAEETGDPTSRAAAALWSMRCASCHGERGRGDGPGKPPGAPVPDFASSAFQRTDAQLHEVIARGRGLMPPFGEEITDTGISALITHVRSLRAQ